MLKDAQSKRGLIIQEPLTSGPVADLSKDQIAARAYELWKARGAPFGSPEVDWCRAEAELNTMARPFGSNG